MSLPSAPPCCSTNHTQSVGSHSTELTAMSPSKTPLLRASVNDCVASTCQPSQPDLRPIDSEHRTTHLSWLGPTALAEAVLGPPADLANSRRRATARRSRHGALTSLRTSGARRLGSPATNLSDRRPISGTGAPELQGHGSAPRYLRDNRSHATHVSSSAVLLTNTSPPRSLDIGSRLRRILTIDVETS